jgi:small subunit ribosomal protein S21
MAISVEVRGDIETAIKILKRKVQKDGLQRELKRRRYHEKPSVRKKRKRVEAVRRRNKLNNRF